MSNHMLFLSLVTPAFAHCCPEKNEKNLLKNMMGNSFKERSSTQALIVEKATYPQTCHPRVGGGPGDQTRSPRREKPRSLDILPVALGPRLRGGDKFGGCNIPLQPPSRARLDVFPGQQYACAGVTRIGINISQTTYA
jgi:hypothetical protein